ncbi:peptidase S8/S53 domain-containing protein [Mycena rebaudengoi]|nr:peptidase S8/S53 domain-containing protein [Mycena rebaudengoi]
MTKPLPIRLPGAEANLDIEYTVGIAGGVPAIFSLEKVINITSIGGTTGLPLQVAASLSGCGFSDHFIRPAYQEYDVATFLASIGDQYASLYNTTDRAFPDVAAQAEVVVVAWNCGYEPYRRLVAHSRTSPDLAKFLVGGTSASSPIFASIISLSTTSSSPPVICYYFGPTLRQIFNSASFVAGKPVLGFLNPFLYSAAGRAAFADVVSGTNPGCHTEGFSSKAGWDPVTGLGTPDYNLLLNAVGL